MRRNKRDTDKIVIQKIIGYCNDIEDLMTEFNATYEVYLAKRALRYSCDMCIFQIGELTTRLTENFKAQHTEIPWHEIKALRNIHAHEYESINFEAMWETLTEDIPALKAQLEKIFPQD